MGTSELHGIQFHIYLWEEIGAIRGNPSECRENMQTPYIGLVETPGYNAASLYGNYVSETNQWGFLQISRTKRFHISYFL